VISLKTSSKAAFIVTKSSWVIKCKTVQATDERQFQKAIFVELCFTEEPSAIVLDTARPFFSFC
jgi:hypothetical protein